MPDERLAQSTLPSGTGCVECPVTGEYENKCSRYVKISRCLAAGQRVVHTLANTLEGERPRTRSLSKSLGRAVSRLLVT